MAKKFDYEAAEKQLQGIILSLEDGSLGMEQTLAAYKKGVRLINDMNKYLDDMQGRINILQGGEEKSLEGADDEL